MLASVLLTKSGVLFSSKKFKHFADEALFSNSSRFMELADKYFSSYVREARKDFDIKGGEILKSVDPVRQTLDRYEQRLNEMERDREKAYGSISQKLLEMGKPRVCSMLKPPILSKHCAFPMSEGDGGKLP